MIATLTLDKSTTDLSRKYPDPSQRWEVTRLAMLFYLLTTDDLSGDFDRDGLTEYVTELSPVTSANDIGYFTRRSEVREYAIENSRFEDGDNDKEDTIAFLRAFDLELPSLTTRKRVTVLATVTFTIDNDKDEGDTERDIERFLRLEVSGDVDDLDESDADVSINSVSIEIDD